MADNTEQFEAALQALAGRHGVPLLVVVYPAGGRLRVTPFSAGPGHEARGAVIQRVVGAALAAHLDAINGGEA